MLIRNDLTSLFDNYRLMAPFYWDLKFILSKEFRLATIITLMVRDRQRSLVDCFL